MTVARYVALAVLLAATYWLGAKQSWEALLTAGSALGAFVTLEAKRPNRDRKSPDVELLREFMVLLPYDGVMRTLETHDFGGAIRYNVLAPIREFSVSWNDAAHQFHDKRMANQLNQLRKKVDDFLSDFARYTFSDQQCVFSAIPHEWADTRPEEYQTARRRLNDLAGDIFRAHQEIVSRGRAKYGLWL